MLKADLAQAQAMLAALDPATLERLEQDLAALIDVLGGDERGARIPLGQR